MKKLLTAIMALGFAATSLVGCKKGKGNNSNPHGDDQVIAVVDIFGVPELSTKVQSGTLLDDLDTNSDQYALDANEAKWVYLNDQGYEIDVQKSVYLSFEIRYILKLTLYASEGYRFNNQTAITMNGNIESPRKDFDNGGRKLTLYKEYQPLDPVVRRVMIQGVTEPVGGEYATTSGIELYNCEGAWVQSSTVSTYWIHNGDYKFDNGNMFTAGKEYIIKVMIEGARYNYFGQQRRCTFANDVEVTVNGKTATNITFYQNNESISVKYSFTAVDPEA